MNVRTYPVKVGVLFLIVGAILYFSMSRPSLAKPRRAEDDWKPEYGEDMAKQTFVRLNDYATECLLGLRGKNTKEVMNKLYGTIYPLGEKEQKRFTEQIEQMFKLQDGRPANHEFIQYRFLGNSNRYYLMDYLTYHGKNQVTAWEFEFVKVKGVPAWASPWRGPC